MNRNISNEINNKNLPHIGILNALSSELVQALSIISSSPLETLPDPEPEIEEKKKKLLINIIPSEEERSIYSEYEIQATTMIKKIATTSIYKLKHAMFKKMLLKLITSFYEDRAKDAKTKSEFGIFVFTCLMKKYMMKKAAQNRFKHLLSSCIKYKTISRIRLFARFLGLYQSFDLDDLNLYLTTSASLKAGLTGKSFSNSDADEKHMTSYARCIECLKLLAKTLPQEEIQEISVKLDLIKTNDVYTKQNIVNIDEFLEILIEKYHYYKSESYNFIKYIYEAGDVRSK
jgi:hypothetical protein